MSPVPDEPPRKVGDPTLDLWQQRTSRELTEGDAREITQNATGFFRLLLEWRRTADQTEVRSEVQAGKPAVTPEAAHSESVVLKSPGT